jgi:Peptidase_C39 like family
LTEAEQFLAAGIPLVASIATGPHELAGFLFAGGTDGHLVVIAGFTDAGDPIVIDPAATSDATVRRVYDRGQFERTRLGGSGGIVYVIHPRRCRCRRGCRTAPRTGSRVRPGWADNTLLVERGARTPWPGSP